MTRGVLAIVSGAAAMTLAALIASGAGERAPGAAGTASAAEEQGERTSRPAPLVVDKNAPRLLDEPGEPSAEAATGPVADNSACFVCHDNYREEPLVDCHAVENVGCVDCHGRHRLKRRTVRWDKQTGRLIVRDRN